MAEAPRRIEIPLTVEHDGETVEIGRLCYVREDVAERENAELRELVLDMWLHSYCSIAKTREDDERHIEDVIDRMRELGVEVDE